MKLDKIKPNLDIYIDCYIAALIFIMQYYDLNTAPLYLNTLSFFSDNFLKLQIKKKETIKDILMDAGIYYCERKIDNDDVIDIIKEFLDKDIPVAIDIDMFYDPICAGTYKKKHARHILTIYGYEENFFNILEINWINSSAYKENVISFDDLKNAYASCQTIFKDGKLYLLFYLENKIINIDKTIDDYKLFVKQNLNLIQEGNAKLKEFVKFYIELNDKEKLLSLCNMLQYNITEIIKNRTIEISVFNKFGLSTNILNDTYYNVINLWSGIRAALYKMACIQKYDERLISFCKSKLVQLEFLETDIVKQKEKLCEGI